MSATWVRWLVRDERGSVLVGGLMLVLVMTLVGSGVFYAAVLDNHATLDNGRQSQALYIAQAGLNAALREITDGDHVHDGDQLSTSSNTTLFTNRLIGSGSFSVTAVPISNPSGFMIRSTACVPANCPTGHEEVTVQKFLGTTVTPGGPLQGSNFLFNTFSLNSGEVDGYDSSQPTCQTNPSTCYANTKCPPDPRPPTQLSNCAVELHVNGAGASPTTGTVTISSDSTMYGNITDWRGQVNLGTVYGNVKYRSDIGHCPTDPNCTPNHVRGGGTVTTVTSGGPETMPTVSPCNTLPGGHYTTCNTITNNKITATGATSWSYDQTTGVFSVPQASTPNYPTGNICGGSGGGGNPKILTLAPLAQTDDSTHGQDPGYCFSSFTASGGVRLNPSGNGKVFIYVTGAVSVAGNADINNAQTGGTSNAKQFQIYSSYNTIGQATVGVSISGNATWYLFVNAPQTKITAGGNNTNMYGALIGYDFAITNGNFHFDKVFYNGGVISGPGNISYTWGAWTACKNPSCT